ncbi:MAG TPA: aminotransferase class V-fold PLP-dependent enzyme [Ramlibacter sp.]|uniref:aminotransferase class V-fold PLP-dependent enzyme n=1 Tax=Ramlibacter sp. TaxID=1917967 RepID=UPI002BDB37F6|nr:aminotransferase class V-fold PLP-dependent enzyme [Ramlibacter sp.]HVZ44249.1 aminotransferase class V-fold PLP-dependent enzyme [Ramlibacter sp.]
MSIYQRLGVPPVINAAGTLTRLGGTVMLPEVRDAMSEAACELVPVDELQAMASRAIASACGSEAGLVTSGASAGLTLAAAACMAGLDIVKMDRLPGGAGPRSEIVICRSHRNSYDHAFRVAGATLVEVGFSDRSPGVGVRETEAWEIDAAITENTAAIAYTASASAYPPLSVVSAVARKRRVPVIVDAAGQLPPPSNLRRFIAEGADLVAISGGKALRGPQGTGILAGRSDLIASAALQQLDMDVTFETWLPPPDLIPRDKLTGAPRHGMGRGFKVSKEQIVGLVVALGLFTDERAKADYARWLEVLHVIELGLRNCARVQATLVPPRQALGFPLLEVQLDPKETALTAYELVARMKKGRPAIHLGERRLMDGGILVHPASLDQATARIVLQRLLAELQAP